MTEFVDLQLAKRLRDEDHFLSGCLDVTRPGTTADLIWERRTEIRSHFAEGNIQGELLVCPS
jgi:hypothetical protein